MKLLRVMVVEDDAMIAKILSETAIQPAFNVCAIKATEVDATAAAFCFQPDMLIVADGLSQGNGFSAMETILSTGLVSHMFVSRDPLLVRVQRPGAVVIQMPFFVCVIVRAFEIPRTATITS